MSTNAEVRCSWCCCTRKPLFRTHATLMVSGSTPTELNFVFTVFCSTEAFRATEDNIILHQNLHYLHSWAATVGCACFHRWHFALLASTLLSVVVSLVKSNPIHTFALQNKSGFDCSTSKPTCGRKILGSISKLSIFCLFMSSIDRFGPGLFFYIYFACLAEL